MKEGNKRIREVGMLKWIYYVRPENPPGNHVPGESQKDAPIVKVIKNDLVKRAPAPRKCSVVLLSTDQSCL